MKDLRCP